ncbi:MAG TPA: hypothetical protein PLK08_04515 [Phycisphaerae bacterium]|nr:hypothetical protein [Phycisphaerae bacterium]
MESTKRLLRADNGSRFISASAQSLNKTGQPAQKFLKDMIRCGVYKHPVHGWTLDVTPQRMDNWVAAFNRMKENGVDVEVPIDHSMSAEDNRGYVVDMFRGGTEAAKDYPQATDPKTLYGVHELIGDDSIELASRCKNVSVLIERDFVDGQGVAYGEAITHSSIVQQPIVPGQGDFIPLSKAGDVNAPIPVFVLSSEASKGKNKKNNVENTNMELFDGLKQQFGFGDDVTEENILSRIKESVDKTAEDNKTLSKQVTELNAKVESLTAKVDDGKAASKIDPDALDGLVEGTEARIEKLQACGKLTPAAAKVAHDVLIGEPGKRNTLMLSRKASGMDESIAKKVLSIVEANDPKELGEMTKSQTLSRQTPGEQPPAVDAEIQKSMIKACE